MLKKTTNYFLLILFVAFLSGCHTGKKRLVSEELRTRALDELKSSLNSEPGREKIHAAEYLLSLGYTEGIHELFLEEEKQRGTEKFHRIGIWRTLARSSIKAEEKQQWIDSIGNVFKNPDAPDRVRAAESLAKLGISPSTISPGMTDSILNGEHNPLWLYTLWGTAYSQDNKAEGVKGQIVDIACQKEEPGEIRKLAACALRNLKDHEADTWYLLLDAAKDEPRDSSLYACLLSSAIANTPKDSLLSPGGIELKSSLLSCLTNSGSPAKDEAIAALGDIGSYEELPELIDILKNKGDEGLKIAASNAVLRIDRRQQYTLSMIDWGVIALYGLGMLLVGWYYSRKTKDTEDYLLGGRKMKPISVGVSLFATMVSSLSYLSYPGEMVKNGPIFFIGMIIFPVIYYIVGWFIIPKFMEMKVSSAYELLEQRLGLSVRILATFFFLTLRFLWMATIIYATIDTALAAIVDINPAYTPFISIFLMLLTIIYTSMGGFRAVVTTDVIQSVVLWGGAFLAILVVSLHFGSITDWLPDHYFAHWSPMKWGFDARERSTVGNAMIMLLVWFVCTNGSDQMAVQRYLATKDVHAARRTFGISLIATFIVKIFLGLVGIAMIAYFTANPHFLNDGQTMIGQADRLFPKFILVGLPVGISGLVASGIFAAAMSSLSSGLNSSSSVISEDILKRLMPRLVSKDPLKQVKKISVLVGIIAILFSLLVGNVHGNLLDVVIKVVNLFVAPLFVLFFMAIFIPFATSRGTITGGLVSVAMAVATAFWEFMGITVLWIMPSALIVGVLAGVLASLIEKISKKYAVKR